MEDNNLIMISLLEDWSEDALEYLTQISWIDDDTAKEIMKIAKERIPSGRLVNAIEKIGNEIFDAIAKDQDFQNISSTYDDNPTYENGDAVRNAAKKVVSSLQLGSRYQSALSPFFPNLKSPKITITNNGYADVVEINFREAGIFISNENYSGFGYNDGSDGMVSELDINLSLKNNEEDIIEFVIDLPTGILDLSDANERTGEIGDIVIDKKFPLQETLRVCKLRELIRPLVRNKRQYLETVKAMYYIRNI